MICTNGTGCSHSNNCPDHDCPGRGTADDEGYEALGKLLLVAVSGVVAVYGFVELVIIVGTKLGWL